ncbi:hypothetical protein [Paenibacillus glycanilyticus]|uniref:Uncharacterized protein n=1 Tax=Paenibacillus glycanilyticus TaxID=126569 RepID=A0ABQ6GFE2_9BACL|nr:hypothetical protein [Paenibacillus glycanilyticus]GLX68051.1 hypothetical protein MU1_23960 [Paenibacillus glycanilyticus]
MKRISAIMVVIVIMFAGFIYLRIGPLSSTHALDSQLDNLIQNHDKAAIQALALDQETVEYLFELPNDSKVSRTSDFQGGYKNVSYKVTSVGGSKIHVYMKEDHKSMVHKLFPRWTLYKLTIGPNGTLPSIRDIYPD